MVLPSTMRTIGVESFSYCFALEKIVLPASLRTIRDYAFLNCSSLQQLVIPKNVTSLGEHFVKECKAMTMLYVEGSVDRLPRDTYPMPVYADFDSDTEGSILWSPMPFPFSDLHFDPLTAQELTEGDFSYVISDGKATVTAIPAEENVIIPDTLGGAPVCYLLPNLCSSLKSLPIKSVTLPQTVEELPAKRNTRNQKQFEKLLVMRFENVKLTVGLQRSNQDLVQYCITVPQMPK